MTENITLDTFDQLYIELRPRFIRFANSYVRDVSIAEDLTAEAFVAYWENKDKISISSKIPSYILTIVKNKCLNYLEHIKVKSLVLSNISELAVWELNTRIISLEACNPDRLFSDEIQQIVEETLSELNERTAVIFRLSRDKNLSNREISEILDISIKGVEFHISKALSALRKALKIIIRSIYYSSIYTKIDLFFHFY